MKKFQKLVKDNMDLILLSESKLIDEFNHYGSEFNISPYNRDSLICTILFSSGALALIDDNFNFNKLSSSVAFSFAELILAYVVWRSPMLNERDIKSNDDIYVLMNGIKDNIRYHRKRDNKGW